MNRKKARFDVVSIEVTVHCPHCDSLIQPPSSLATQGISDANTFLWDESDIRHAFGKDIDCVRCNRPFGLPNALRNLLMPSSMPVSDSAAPRITATEIICGDCSGPGLEPRRTLLTKDNRCATCGGQNYTLAAKLQPDETQNGKDNLNDTAASHSETEGSRRTAG